MGIFGVAHCLLVWCMASRFLESPLWRFLCVLRGGVKVFVWVDSKGQGEGHRRRFLIVEYLLDSRGYRGYMYMLMYMSVYMLW